jgi:hypothetical protein
MKTGLRKVAFEVRVSITVIVPPAWLSSEIVGRTCEVSKAKVQPLVQLIFRDQIKLVANVRACTRMGTAIAGYTHFLAHHAGPMMQDVCEQPHAQLGVYISREPDADIALGVEFTNECNLACAFCYRDPTRADCLSPGRILYLFRLHPGV